MQTSWVAGVDSFRREWLVVSVNHAQGRVIGIRHHVCGSFEEILKLRIEWETFTFLSI